MIDNKPWNNSKIKQWATKIYKISIDDIREKLVPILKYKIFD